MSEFRILKSAKLTGQTEMLVDFATITVLVGANASGKTTFLRELHQHYTENRNPTRWIESVIVPTPTYQQFAKYHHEVTEGELPHEEEMVAAQGRVDISWQLSNQRAGFFVEDVGIWRLKEASNVSLWRGVNSRLLQAGHRILGTERLQLRARPAENFVTRFFQNTAFRNDLRENVKAAFDQFIVLDHLDTHSCMFKLAQKSPEEVGVDEQSLGEKTQKYLLDAVALSDSSHGVQSYTALVCHAYDPQPRLLLIDEPEISLAPPLARMLGSRLAAICKRERKQLVASTHSADFVLGCIQGGVEVSVVRLDRTGTAPSVRALEPAVVKKMMQDPLLRSTSVVDALFHKYAIVTEADADRAFYEEINHRLHQAGERGVPDSVFLRAQNKHTIPKIMGMLRSIGVPAAGIVDWDVIKEGGAVWSNFMRGAGVPDTTRAGMEIVRQRLCAMSKELDEKHGQSDYIRRHGGVSAVPEAHRESVEHFIGDLAKYGLFVVEVGELEQWLPNLDVPRSKHSWLYAIFKAMGDDPSDKAYVRPEAGKDVWRFIDAIGEWCENPHRSGMSQMQPLDDNA